MTYRKKSPGKKAPASQPPAKKPAPSKRSEKDKRSFEERVHAAMTTVDATFKGRVTSLILKDAEDNPESLDAFLWSAPQYFVSTQSIAIDKALGLPGIPAGRITEIYGPPSSGKSTLLDHLIAEVQRKGGIAVLCDTEHARDLKYMRAIGIDTSRIIIVQVQTIEDVFATLTGYAVQLREQLGPGVPILFAWDSIAETPTIAEMAAEHGEKFRAEAAKAIHQAIRTSAQVISKNQVAVVFVNQTYKKMAGYGHGDGDETYGGNAVKFAASIRLDLLSVAGLKPPGAGDDDRVPPAGNIVSLRVVKNKLASPWRKRNFAIRYGQGIDNGWSLWNDFAGKPEFRYASEDPAIVQNGAWYSIAPSVQSKLGIDLKSWQGGHWPLAQICADNPGLWDELVFRYKELPQ